MKAERILKSEALRAVLRKLPIRGDKALQQNLECFTDSLAEAYRVGAEEAQREIAGRIQALGGKTCDHRDAHDVAADKPTGERCGAKATHRISWEDGRYSFGCDDHLKIDDTATVKPIRIVKL